MLRSQRITSWLPVIVAYLRVDSSRSFKVTDFCFSQKPTDDFLLVNSRATKIQSQVKRFELTLQYIVVIDKKKQIKVTLRRMYRRQKKQYNSDACSLSFVYHRLRHTALWGVQNQLPHTIQPLIKGSPSEFPRETSLVKSWGIVLRFSGNRMIVAAAILSQHTPITDGWQTDDMIL